MEIVIQLLSAFDCKKIYPKEGTKEDAFEKAVEKQEEEENSLLPSGIYTIHSNRKGFGKIEAKLEIKNGKLMLKKVVSVHLLNTNQHINIGRMLQS